MYSYIDSVEYSSNWMSSSVVLHEVYSIMTDLLTDLTDYSTTVIVSF